MAKDDERAKRLAEALRANLRRRKAQARSARDGEGENVDLPGGAGKGATDSR